MEKTLNEILEATKIGRSLFQKYKTLGLLPRPTRIEIPKGHGSIAYYPENIICLIQWIREWQAEGETLRQIQEKLSHMRDVTPKEEILVSVGSDDQADFAKALAKEIDEVHHRLDPDNPAPRDFWVRFEFIEKDGKKFYRVVSALSRPKR